MSQEIDSKEFYPMTRNVMFHGVFTRNKVALAGLVRSVLHLKEEDVNDIILLSSTEPPLDADGKLFILDVKVILKDKTIINLEMQTDEDEDWPNRSLSYLCRNYDNLNRGQPYDQVTPTIHIGFLGFTLFKNRTKFCSTYKLCDIDDQHVYSDKFTLKVVQLKQSENATKDDREFGIDRWAKLFLATSREELFMIAQDDASMSEAVKTAILMNEDWELREAMIRRELYNKKVSRLEKRIEEQDAEIASLADEITRLKNELEEAKRK
ncbi:Rpn family recombination-promoting nuclease/putative transposase [Butyrivibrio sp. AE3006]|uniref:Rpn family recombination-promoting nuclease/putative transposase n=1 Tax=Butyrivibrio sp. AE3006 TaxID=1280673 RepID=UPI00041E63E2|nr:Rpn family recombination-promoting nuclease/putative transposase [Butyrivibrio sp. AE3006]